MLKWWILRYDSFIQRHGPKSLSELRNKNDRPEWIVFTRTNRDVAQIRDEVGGRMLTLTEELWSLTENDIFSAETDAGRELICRVIHISDFLIHGRTLFTRYAVQFSRVDGLGIFGTNGVPCRIDAVARLPDGIYNALIILDQRHSAPWSEDQARLTRNEIDAVMFLSDFYKKHRLQRLP